MVKLGLSFSGGGIRSAAFCSGVLRRLLQKNVVIDYLSCVSGGGYTGTAYLDWKYRHGKKDDKRWHQDFFDHIRENAGLICHLQKPCKAVLEFLALLTIILFVSFLAPAIIWRSSAFPMAYIIDLLFGSILRGGDPPCPEEVRSNPNITIEQCEQSRRTTEFITLRFILFSVPVIVLLISYVIKGFVQKGKGFFNFITTSGIMFFGFVFIPWFITNSYVFFQHGWKSWSFSPCSSFGFHFRPCVKTQHWWPFCTHTLLLFRWEFNTSIPLVLSTVMKSSIDCWVCLQLSRFLFLSLHPYSNVLFTCMSGKINNQNI